MTCTDNEMAFVQKLAGRFPRHPQQVNGLFEADGEIIDLRNQNPDYLVAKTDSIAEEIRQGLYNDPYTIGWMAVTAPVSDLAATGADLTGVLLSVQLQQACDGAWIRQFQQGVCEACAAYETFVLGGDTSAGRGVSVTATAIGTRCGQQPLLRSRIQPGDRLYTTGALGRGAAFAYAHFFAGQQSNRYKPLARVAESKIIRRFAQACIDTSDGLFPALSVLAEVNGTGLNIHLPLQRILCAKTTAVYLQANLPAWTLLAGPHGEYELLFAVTPRNANEFEAACADEGWQPLFIGYATAEPTVSFVSESLPVRCHPAEIANLFGRCNGNVQRYHQRLLAQHEKWATTTTSVC